MAKSRFVIATVVLIVGLSVAAQQRRSSQASIQGVWRVVEETSGGRTITDPNLGFIIYTAKHYALVRETGNKPRPDVSDVDNATAEQLLAMWGRFAAQFGTYEVNGDLVTLNILVAKNPSLMKTRQVRRFKLEGDTLVDEAFRDQSGQALSKPIGLKMTRVE